MLQRYLTFLTKNLPKSNTEVLFEGLASFNFILLMPLYLLMRFDYLDIQKMRRGGQHFFLGFS